ncbi:G patch domain-containing protein 8-like isoform X2 [Pseudophryne corroboree]|uniref:G patch domain-containing protein 8-like isoform X2 n=1 Tax=Pseudophryne corroboree TaxID=495146 RepID=UPI003081A7C6
MSAQPPRPCAFCPELEENEEIGKLLVSPDGAIVAHSNCMLFSPQVVSKDTYSQDFFGELNVKSVETEIERARKLRCFYCKAKGASVGCDNETCRRTYHYLCVKKAKGKYICDPEKEIYIAFCPDHKDTEENTTNISSHLPRSPPESPTPENPTSQSPTPESPTVQHELLREMRTDRGAALEAYEQLMAIQDRQAKAMEVLGDTMAAGQKRVAAGMERMASGQERMADALEKMTDAQERHNQFLDSMLRRVTAQLNQSQPALVPSSTDGHSPLGIRKQIKRRRLEMTGSVRKKRKIEKPDGTGVMQDDKRRQEPDSDHTALSEETDSGHTARREEPISDHTARREEPGSDHTARREEPGSDHTARREEPGSDHTARREEPGSDHTAQREEPGSDHTARREEPGSDHTARREEPDSDHTARREEPGRDHTARREEPGRDHTDCSVVKSKRNNAETPWTSASTRQWIITSDSDNDVLMLVTSDDSTNTVKVSGRCPPESQSLNQEEPKPGTSGTQRLQPALRQQSTTTHQPTQRQAPYITLAAASVGSDGEMQFETDVESTLVEASEESPEQLKETLHPAPHNGTSDSGSEASDSLLSPNIKWAISLSGLPIKGRKHGPKRTTNPQLEEKLITMSSEEREICEQMYTDHGGSLPSSSQERCSTQDYVKTETDSNEVNEEQTHSGNPDLRRGNTRQPAAERDSSDVGRTTINQPQTGPKVVGGKQEANLGLKPCDGHCLCYHRLEDKIDRLLKEQEILMSSLEAQEKKTNLVH